MLSFRISNTTIYEFVSPRDARCEDDKVMAGETPANPARRVCYYDVDV
jgi:hypothetical protein